MINFSTDNITFVEYIPGAGGKFLINCCALSEYSVLQSSYYAHEQLSNRLSSNDKFNMLYGNVEMDDANNWKDFGSDVGCYELFGKASWNLYNEDDYHPIIDTLSNIDETCVFYKVTHSRGFSQQGIQLWKNAKMIVFINDSEFVTKFRPTYVDQMITRRDEYWKNIRASEWPLKSPSTYTEYLNLSSVIKTELKDIFHNEILGYISDDTKLDSIYFEWDTCWYTDVSLTILNIERVYEFLGLPDFKENVENIEKLYYIWALRNGIV
jgi:hypothetical protein